MKAKIENFIKNNWLILIFIFSGAILRIGYSQIQLNPLINDNAKNACEASHFLDNFSFKTLLNIPAHLEISSWALLFKVFGNNTFSYNLLGIIQYIILSIFFYLAIEKIASQKVALVSSFLLAFSPPIFTLNSVFWSGHSRSAMFSWIIFYLFCLLWERPTLKRFLILGLLGGIATGIYPFAPVIALVASITILILKDRKILREKEFFIFLIVFAFFFLFFLNFNQPAKGPAYASLGKIKFYNLNLGFFKKFIQIVRISFSIAGVNSTYQLRVGFQNELLKIIYGLIFSLATAFWLFMNRKGIFKVPPQMLIFPLYLLLFFSTFALTGVGIATRYYLPVIPFYIYFLSDGLVKLSESRIKKLKIFGICAMFFIFAFSIADNLHFYPSPYKGIFELIRFAKQNNIKAVFTNYHMQFALVFYSQETIAGSSPFDMALNNASKFDEIVQNSPSISYLLEGKNSLPFEECLREQKITYQQRNFDRLLLYYGLSRRLEPDECP